MREARKHLNKFYRDSFMRRNDIDFRIFFILRKDKKNYFVFNF